MKNSHFQKCVIFTLRNQVKDNFTSNNIEGNEFVNLIIKGRIGKQELTLGQTTIKMLTLILRQATKEMWTLILQWSEYIKG